MTRKQIRLFAAAGCVGMIGTLSSARDIVQSPFNVLAGSDGVIGATLVLDAERYDQLRDMQLLDMRDFVLDADLSVDLELEQFRVFAPDALFVAADGDAEQLLDAPDVTFLRGIVAGEPDSVVYLALSPMGSNGYVMLNGQTYVVSSGPFTDNLDTVVYNLTALPDGQIIWNDFVCGASQLVDDQQAKPEIGGGIGLRSTHTCRQTIMAVDSDYEFTNILFGGDTAASTAYIGVLFGAVNEIYSRDVAIEVLVTYTRVWSSNTDPYFSNNLFDAFAEFKGEWKTNPSLIAIDRTLAHHVSYRRYSGAAGVASLDALCLPETVAYAVSGYMNGSFPYPLIDNNSQNWDPVVVSHEMGHNHGTGHTHDSFTPPIDNCGNGDCSLAASGTIMSYCHTCPGGMTNIRLGFHELVSSRIDNFVRTWPLCDDLIPIDAQITQQPTDTEVCIGLDATFDVAHSGPGQFTYQWYKDGLAIPNETSQTLLFQSVQPDDAGAYMVVVDSGCESIISTAATLTVCGTDCNGNGLDDALDIGVTSLDCNNNFIPDECDVVPQNFAKSSPQLAPLGFGITNSHIFANVPIAMNDIMLDFSARGDLSDPTERVTVFVGSLVVGFAFESFGTDCPFDPDLDQIIVPANTWNSARDANGDVEVRMVANTGVNPNQCGFGTYIQVNASYTAQQGSLDENSNSIPDECEAVAACSEADVTTTGAGQGDPGFGLPDGQITGADINYYVNIWILGCP